MIAYTGGVFPDFFAGGMAQSVVPTGTFVEKHMVALDIRFNLLTGWKPAILRAVGWLLRTVIVLFSSVTVFFCGRVITGGIGLQLPPLLSSLFLEMTRFTRTVMVRYYRYQCIID